MVKIKKQVIYSFAFLSLLPVLFNNCSQGSVPKTAIGNTASSTIDGVFSTGDICEDSLGNLFSRGYYQFVRTNCNHCHEKDVDKPQFASKDMMWGYQVFMDKGYQKISANAISSAHQPPYTGSHHSATISSLKDEFQKGIAEYNKCKGKIEIVDSVDPKSLLTLALVNKDIGTMAIGTTKVISWDLSNTLVAYVPNTTVPNLSGATFKATVGRYRTSGGTDYYTVSKPTILSGTKEIKVEIMYVKINDRLLDYPTTFKFIDVGLQEGTDDSTGQISTGALTAPRTISNEDKISFVFAKLQQEDIPEPLPPVIAEFDTAGGTDGNVIEVTSSTQSYDLKVNFTGTFVEPGTVTLEIISSAQCATTGEGPFTVNSSTCHPLVNARDSGAQVKLARSIVGTTFNRFDWDYNFKGASATVEGTNPTKTLTLKFSTDERKESYDRLLIVKLNSASSNVSIASSNNTKYFLFRKKTNPTPSAVTFRQLSISTGVFFQKCIECHNSRDLNGNFDITNYESLTNNSAKIFQVIDLDLVAQSALPSGSRNSNYLGTGLDLNTLDATGIVNKTRMLMRLDRAESNLTPMPIKGTLDLPTRDLVREWIAAGAKNN